MRDVLLVGHVVKDRFPDEGNRQMPGGTAYYAAIALASLGARVKVVTKVALSDRDLLLGELTEAGIEVVEQKTQATTEFVHSFPEGRTAERVLTLRRQAEPFEPRDLGTARAAIGYAGPLSVRDVPAVTLRALGDLCGRVAIDLQGLVRHVDGDMIALRSSSDAREALSLVQVVKADLTEAAAVTGEREPEAAARALAALGPEEAIVTMNDRGSVVFFDGAAVRLPAFPPEPFADATGCGDTYLAAYLYARLHDGHPYEAAGFAAAAAACKLQQKGPLRRGAEEVRRLLGRHDADAGPHRPEPRVARSRC
jgi:sugar/nucleoside kinase (ribokinase family)